MILEWIKMNFFGFFVIGFVWLCDILKLNGFILVGKLIWWVGCKDGCFLKLIKFGFGVIVWRVEDIWEFFECVVDEEV